MPTLAQRARRRDAAVLAHRRPARPARLVALARPAPAPGWALAARAAARWRLLAALWRGAVTRRAARVRRSALALLAAAVGHWQLDRLCCGRSFAADHVQRLGRRDAPRCAAASPSRRLRRPAATRLVLEVGGGATRRRVAAGAAAACRSRCGRPPSPGSAATASRRCSALRRPRNFGNPGEFDYEAYLARRGIYVTGVRGRATQAGGGRAAAGRLGGGARALARRGGADHRARR